jgi:trans-aconitate methyltransferase
MTKLYSELAEWWPLLSAPEDYEEEAAFYTRTLKVACRIPPRTLLELGSGGGNNASHMKSQFEDVTLVDPSDGMLAHSRRLNPECEHVVGDMRTVRLGRIFDCVFVHDAVMYMTTEADLQLAMETAFIHCAAGGAALFAPDAVKETYVTSTEHGGHDGETRSLRYLEWAWDPDPSDDTAIAEYVYALREADGTVQVVHDRHVEGLFSRNTWLRLLAEVGFTPSVITFDHSELEPGSYELFLAQKAGE